MAGEVRILLVPISEITVNPGRREAAPGDVKELADSAVILGIRCWFLNEDYWDGRAAVLEKSKLALDDNGISIPYPQLDVHMEHRE